MKEDRTATLFLRFSAAKLGQLSSRIGNCLDRLTEEQIWRREGEHENAAGNLVLHLCGNVRQWIMAGVGGQPDTRHRDTEFAARGGKTRGELKQHLEETVGDALEVLEGVSPERLLDHLVVQGFDVAVLDAIYHVVEHFAMHSGQIMLLTKNMSGSGLDFYHDLESGTKRSQVP